MIPKKIHYVWFGNKKTKLMKKCIDSWKNLGYEVYEWNEKTYDINKNVFLKEAYKKQNWAFLSDYIRLDVLYNFGGIYIDTDVLLIKKLEDTLLNTDILIGFQFDCLLGTHFMGAKVKSSFMKIFLDKYNSYKKGEQFIINNNIFNDFFLENVFDFKLNGKNQVLLYKNEKINIYNKFYFGCPRLIGKGYAYHLLDNSWRNKKHIKLKKLFKLIVGDKIYYNLIAYKALKISPYYEKYKRDKMKNI